MSWKQEYIDLFVKKSKEVPFKYFDDLTTEVGKREVYRYLLVNGLIPLTKENLALAPLEDFYIEFELLPKNVQDAVEEVARQKAEEWEYDENVSTDDKEDRGWNIHSVWIKNGKVQEAQIHKTVIAEVTDNYKTPVLNVEVT